MHEYLPGLRLAVLEAQLIDLADEVAYNTADFDDAYLQAGLFKNRRRQSLGSLNLAGAGKRWNRNFPVHPMREQFAEVLGIAGLVGYGLAWKGEDGRSCRSGLGFKRRRCSIASATLGGAYFAGPHHQPWHWKQFLHHTLSIIPSPWPVNAALRGPNRRVVRVLDRIIRINFRQTTSSPRG